MSLFSGMSADKSADASADALAIIITLIMVPINFWRNSDLFKKKKRFSSSKIDKVRAFQRKSLKFFKENLSNTKYESLKRFRSYYNHFWYQIE